uniref:Uncharacterized protein n=1 Tax=Alexandrium monilatum TaxID=311494 RepID=A0A7S4WHM7_9DINO|mmetsp:Transcript_75055/g.231804  ORF Transcript_75055/g.231804 Transcript_75055/m.231804 type:complete len:107 (-) Transcript_75055:65-385(-)
MTRAASCITGLDETSQKMVQCFVVMFLASTVVGFLSWLGLVMRQECCPVGGYSWCTASQDLRSILSVLAGGLCCRLINRGTTEPPSEEGEEEEGSCGSGVFAPLLW